MLAYYSHALWLYLKKNVILICIYLLIVLYFLFYINLILWYLHINIYELCLYPYSICFHHILIYASSLELNSCLIGFGAQCQSFHSMTNPFTRSVFQFIFWFIRLILQVFIEDSQESYTDMPFFFSSAYLLFTLPNYIVDWLVHVLPLYSSEK